MTHRFTYAAFALLLIGVNTHAVTTLPTTLLPDAVSYESFGLNDTENGVSSGAIGTLDYGGKPGCAGTCKATTVLGPFYVQTAPEYGPGDDISGGMAGLPLLVEGSVSRLDGTPMAGAVIDTWHTNGDGFYDVQGPNGLDGLAGRARFRADGGGQF